VNGTTAPGIVRDLASAVRDAGGRALVVGGFVRDSLLAQQHTQSREPKAPSREPRAQSQDRLDIDFEVFGIAEDRLPSLLEQLEENLHPWVAFAVLPLFAFANAGVSLQGLSLENLLEPIPLGIAAGLFAGKAIGIFGATWIAVMGGLAGKPDGATWLQILGVALLGGIGFTMSLFIGMLAFPDPAEAASLRLGVLTGSLLSAVAGYLILKTSVREPARTS